jgi:PAS domain S-box-containing protein
MKIGAGLTNPFAAPADEQQVLRSLFSALSDAILVAGLDGGIVMANPAAARLFGYTTEQLTQLNVDDLVPDAIRHRHAAYRRSYEDNPRPRPMGTHMELVAKRADGSEVMVEIALSPLRNHGLPYVVAGIRDIAAYPRMKQASGAVGQDGGRHARGPGPDRPDTAHRHASTAGGRRRTPAVGTE